MTYRCNNNCRHCWLWLPPDANEQQNELSFDEIVRIVNEARSLGCRKWFISGGEPMLRPDFPEIFDFLTKKNASYILNSNGTLITPRITKLLKRRGTKYIALYGADAKIHDFITRNPGSFEATMRGIAYLKEAGAAFHVQIIPMRDNFQQYGDMVRLAKSLSPHWRVGAMWLYLSAAGNLEKNDEIKNQRLSPREVIEISGHGLSNTSWCDEETANKPCQKKRNDEIFADCATKRQEFHVDPYGQMAFCEFIKDPSLRYDLRKGNMRDGWEQFILSLSKKKFAGQEEYLQNCGSCELKEDCARCPAHSYIEHHRFSAKIDYLCAIAKENRAEKKKWEKSHRRMYQLAGMTIQVDADIPFRENTFSHILKKFEIDIPGPVFLRIRHHFSLPKIIEQALGKEVYHIPPWKIFQKGSAWIYVSVPFDTNVADSSQIIVLNNAHSKAVIYHLNDYAFNKGGSNSLSWISSDQIILAHALVYKQAFYLHSSGILYNGKGLLFVGHSEAGKSTIAKMFRARGGEILCDDRVAVRKWPEGYRIHGTWSHGEVEEVSAKSAPLIGVFFLKKAEENRLAKIVDSKEIIQGLLGCLVKPLTTPEWWDKILDLLPDIAQEVPCYNLYFDRSGKVVDLLVNPA